MKRILLFLSALFIATTAIAHTINWYVDGNIFHTTTCESGENVTPPTAPEKYGYTFQGWDSYIPIEYLEFTGTQWLDTETYGTQNTAVNIIAQSTDTNISNNRMLFGSRTAFEQNAIAIFLTTNEGKVTVDFYDIRFEYLDTSYNKKWQIYNSKDKRYIKNISETIEDNRKIINVFTTPSTLFLGKFSYNQPDYAMNFMGKIYSCQIYDNDVLIRDFIPVLDKDGIPCMYDLVEHKFYYNAGTGNFIAGPIVGE